MSLPSYALTTGIVSLSLADLLEYKMKKGDDKVEPPIDTVSIIVPSYNEERFIEQCLSSIRNQSIFQQYPEYFELILVDSQSTDNTLELGEPYADKVIISPRGKLTARNMAIDLSEGNIIVSADSDAVYSHHWLNALLKPFKKYDVSIAGVVGSTLDSSIANIPKPVYILASSLERYITRPNQMVGRNSAFWKHLFYLSGRFNTNVNQQNLHDMLKEEEYDFGNRLSKLGKIHYQMNANCTHLGGEKVACRLNFESPDTCNKYRIGIERFG